MLDEGVGRFETVEVRSDRGQNWSIVQEGDWLKVIAVTDCFIVTSR